MLADRIQSQLLDFLEGLIEAYYSDKERKKPLLKSSNLQLEKLRYLVRLSKDLQCIDLQRYEVISKKMDDIGRQVGAWLKGISG